MNNKHVKQVSNLLGGLAKKALESVIHAAIFSAVSAKVSEYMDKDKEAKKTESAKNRVESSSCCKNNPAPPVPTEQL
jgi:hypothetical protein